MTSKAIRSPKTARTRGPKPETLKIEGDWKDAIATMFKKGKPPAPKKKATKKKRRAPK